MVIVQKYISGVFMNKIFYSSLSLITVILLTGCGSSDLTQEKNKNISMQHQDYREPQKPTPIGGEHVSDNIQKVKSLRALNTTEVNDIRAKGLVYLNTLRQKAGMITYNAESHLDTAAYNHAHYLMINNAGGHGESSGNPGYTGASPSERVVYAGYLHRMVSENLSSGNSSVYDSIDGLFSAIYHRFGFLSFSMNEIGIGADTSESHPHGNAYNYDMGVSQLRVLCEGESYSGSGAYYYGVCADSQFKIEQSQYDNAMSENKMNNPKYVLWPYENQPDSRPVFFEEDPDPLPECSVSGYPVSVQFNKAKSGEVAVQSFKLYYDANGTEITNTKLLDKDTDPNSRFSAYEYALYPMKRLDWDTKYHVVVSYTEDNTPKNIDWTFKTKALPYPYYKIVQKDSTFNIKSGQTYLLYLPPENCNDGGAGYSMSYSGGLTIESDFYDYNTIQIKVTGSSGSVNISPRNGRDFTLIVAQNDSAIYPSTDEKVNKKAYSDFNGDGISDIFWRNGVANSLWLMHKDGSHQWVPQVDKAKSFQPYL